MSIGHVGSKGELFPPKDIRNRLGMEAGKMVLYRIVQERLVIEIVHSAEEILQQPSKVSVSIEELKKDRLQLSVDASK